MGSNLIDDGVDYLQHYLWCMTMFLLGSTEIWVFLSVFDAIFLAPYIVAVFLFMCVVVGITRLHGNGFSVKHNYEDHIIIRTDPFLDHRYFNYIIEIDTGEKLYLQLDSHYKINDYMFINFKMQISTRKFIDYRVIDRIEKL